MLVQNHYVFGKKKITIKPINTELYLKLRDNLNDSSGNNLNATSVGNLTFDNSIRTSNGNCAYVSNSELLDFKTGSLSFGCSFKINSYSGLAGLIGKTIYAGTVGRYGIYISSGEIRAITQTSEVIVNAVSITPYNDGLFHNVYAVYDRTNGRQKLFIDNILVNERSFNPTSYDYKAPSKFHVGAYGNGSGNGPQSGTYFDGWLKNIFVVQKEISVEESKTLFT